MKKLSASGGRAALLTSAGLAALAFSAPGFAQNADDSVQAEPTEVVPADTGAIVVTGSRINNPNIESANPVTVLTGDQIFETGNTSIGDQLNDLPQLRSTFSQANSTRFLGTRGLNLLDLRGLGTQRTLVLVNGRRHVASDVLSNGVSVDVNTIPSDLVDRIEVVTGGASAVYGSDAIAGVVNFVLKDDFEGIRTRGQIGVSKYGDAGNQFASVLAGTNFGDGRGNITAAFEYSHQNDYYASGRPNLRQNDGFVVTDTDPAGSPNGSDGVFDRTYYTDIRSATISLGGMVAIAQGANAPCGQNVQPFTCTYQFQSDGTLVPQTGTRIGIGPNGNFQGGNGYRGREGQLLALSPDLTRYSANVLGHYEISPALVPFFEAKYVRSEAFGSQSGPFFSQGGTLGDRGGRERIGLDNPYLSGQARNLLTQQFLGSVGQFVNPNGGAITPTVDADGNVVRTAEQNRDILIGQINSGTFAFNLRRNWLDFGARDEKITRETYRIVGGIKGDFNNDWNYELSLNYGEHKEDNLIQGNVNIQRYLLGIDTARDASGNIVCRSQLDPSNTISYVTGNPLSAGDDPQLAGDIAACVPINPFGQGSVTDAARQYVLVDSRANGKITQFQVQGFVAGDTSGFLSLPGGPVSFVLGGEYRRETLVYDLDDLTQAGYAFYNAIPSFTAPSFGVKEAYGEIAIPILSGTPGFEELSLRANGRIADYKGTTGTVYAYGGEAVWKPIEDITLRGTYARSVRAPNLSELYSAAGQNFAPGFADPCSARNLGTGSANRAANCAAAGAPADYDYVYSSSLEIVSGGNADLTEETSDSYTAGVVLQPRFIPGLSISADYYDITVNKAIASVSAQDIVDLCYDSPSLDNIYCPQFQRAGATGGPNGEVPFQILEGSLLQSSLNFAKLKVRGIDTQVSYNRYTNFGRLALNAVWTHVFANDAFTNPSDPTFRDRYLDELNDPTDAVSVNASLTTGAVTFGYSMRWLDAMYLNTYEDYNSVNGNPPENTDYAPIKKYPDTFYHDIRVGVDVNDNFNAYLGVDNVFNTKPPYGLTGVGGGSGIYDNRGQYFYVGFKAKIR